MYIHTVYFFRNFSQIILMASYAVQQFFADYYRTMIFKGSCVSSADSCYLKTLSPRFTDSTTWQFQQLVNKLKREYVQERDVASINSVIIENNYLKHCLQKVQTMKLCDILDIHSNDGQSQSHAISLIPATNKSSSIEEEEMNLSEDGIPRDFLDDFLYLMEATKYLPVRTQNIVVLHFASEYREYLNHQSISKQIVSQKIESKCDSAVFL